MMSFKKKYYLAIGAIVLLLIFSYSTAIKKTIEVYRENKVMKKNMKSFLNSTQQIMHLEYQLGILNENIGSSMDQEFKHYLLQKISEIKSNEIFIKNIPPPIINSEDDIVIKTYKLTLEGDFIPLLQIIHSFELDPNIKALKSVRFQKTHDRKTKTTKVLLSFHVQKIYQNNTLEIVN